MRKNKLYLLFLLLFFCLSQGAYADAKPPKIWGNAGTSGSSEKAYTDKWYQETASSLTISSNLDLGSLIKALNEKKTFEGKTIELTKDIDMSKYQWASTENPFKGVFNGNGHTITGMSNGADSSPWAFIGVVDQGEINEVTVSGSFTGNIVAGGIVGKLTNGGKVLNSAYTGSLASTVDTVRLGGIVGVNDGGTVSNCFFVGSTILTAGTVAGSIAGASTGTISNSYYLLNENIALGVGEDTGTTTEVKDQTAESFALGEVSWLLNQYGGTHSGIWSQGKTLPVYASDTHKAVYKVTYIDSEKGSVSGKEYVIADSIVNLTSTPAMGYLCSGFTILGADVDVIENSFIMPAVDVQLTGNFVDFQGPAINEVTDITSSGFTAHWEAVEGAVDYLLTVKTMEGIVLESYNGLSLGDTTSYNVINLLPETEYKYYIQVKNSESVSQMTEATVKTIKGSTVTYSPNVAGFKVGNNAVESQTIFVSGNYLTTDINVTLPETKDFSVSAITLPKEGGYLTITYHPTTLGSQDVMLTLSTTGAPEVKIPLKGISELAAPKPTIASVEKYSFLAKWSAVAFAEKYLLTLTQDKTVIEEYDNVETTECFYAFDKLKVNTKYALTVSTVLAEDTLVSQVMTVTTSGDYGKQLNNSGFEYWEGADDNAEPVDWSSFMTASSAGSLTDMAKTCHMKPASDSRPNGIGILSARIWSVEPIKGTIANGNLTCGRINAGSTTTTDEANHNYTVVGNPSFSEALNGAKPDSLTVWVKYNPIITTDQARVSAIIHDTYKYQDPTTNPEILKHKTAEAILDYSATEDKGWQRLSIPFNYCGPSISADYMLVTFASNKAPGGGSKNDEVFIDDMLLVYNPKVAISKVDRTSYKQGGAISVNYTLEGTMSPSNLNAEPNVVTLQLSNAEGSFENPTILTSVTTDYSGTLTAVIPEDCPVGKGYRVRVITTNYPMISEASADDIEIFEPGASNISSSKIDAFAVTAGASAEQIIKVEGIYLVKGIKIALDKSDQGFTIDKTTLPEEGGDIVVTYSPVSVGTNAAIITLSSDGLDKTVTINLSGMSRPVAPILSEVSHITPAGFTINWEAVENATDYELTVTPVEGETITKSVGVATSYEFTDMTPATEYNYSLLVKVGEIASLPSVSSTSVTTLNKPVIVADTDSIGFGTVTVGGESEVKSVAITTSDLYGNIKVEVTDDNFDLIPLSADEENKIVKLAYKPVVVSANHKAMLTITTEFGNTLEIKLTGSSLPKATRALTAEEITAETFLAKWDAVEGAIYRLTVKTGDEVLSGYDAALIRKGNSVTVKGLTPSTKYTYSVVVVLNGQDSEVSNEVEVTTLPLAGIKDISSSKMTVYPNPVINDLYIQGANAQKVDVFTLDGVYAATYRVQENKINVSSLHAGSYIFVITDEEGNTCKVRVMKE